MQPLIQRLYDTRTRDEFLALLANEPARNAYDLTRDTWRRAATGDFETWWRTVLHDGVIAGTAGKPVTVSAVQPPQLPESKPTPDLTLVLSPDPAVWDGRFANNA
jgi:molybdopterin-containing oxidoreductase family iron-sulfur binding subunit